MPQIFVLPEHIASQIAAGEVVERPASVVKELVENSIDAGAGKIVVDISEGCRKIRVSDNGCGMETDDASLAFQRHATSKLKSADDLWNLNSLGFRGEALPSIASVSKLICFTRTDKKDIGTKVTSTDGGMTVSETGCAKGTIIEVEDLFYNVPARLKFLKKPTTEFAHIYEIMQSLAITYPKISFELSLDGTKKLKTLGSGLLDQAINESGFTTESSSFLTVKAKDGVLGLEIEGRLISPKNFRGDRKGILTIVNNRPVRCSLALKALDYAYADLIPKGRYPLAVVHLKVNPSELDINIHPTKKEIRYSRGNDVYLFLQRQIMHTLRIADNGRSLAIAQALSTDSTVERSSEVMDFEPLPESRLNKSINFGSSSFSYYEVERSQQLPLQETGEMLYTPSSVAIDSAFADRSFGSTLMFDLRTQSKAPTLDQTKSVLVQLPVDWKIVGYLAHTYILLETKDGLSIVEQHIAHERTLYEKLLASEKQVEGQNIVISLPLQLTAEQKIALEENKKELSEQGFEFEVSKQEIACTQVPVELAHKDYAGIIQTMLQELAESTQTNPKLEIVKSLACQSAIKNGMHLAYDQIVDLLSQWHNTPRNETCPHGRPIQLAFSYDKLFQMFHPK